jgi:CubicO group peptidase (beta-lactamase class C family)
MKKRTLILLALGLALNSCAQKHEKKIEEINGFLSYHEKLNKFNGAVLVAQGNKVLLTKGYGYRSFESKKLNDTTSIFQIYSITKTFTSTLIFKLIEMKKLSLADRLSKFYPAFPNGDNITLKHLLTHTSGINDTRAPNARETEEDRLSTFGKNKPHFAPGEGWAYCNGGYQLLGYIIQKITGMPYEHAIREYIFNPLGMSKSGFDFKGLSRPEKTTGYHTFTNDIKEIAVLYDSAGPFSAGAIYSTVGDLYKYYKSFKSHQIINEASQQIAFTSTKANKGYGHGWQLNNGFFKGTTIYHTGGAVGFRSNFTMIPEEDICIIILNNHENANPEYLTREIIDILNSKSVDLTQEIALTTSQLEKLVGAYSIKEPQPMMIYTSIVDGRLAVQVAGQGKATVVAKDENTFVQAEAGVILEFRKDEKGFYSEMEIDQGWLHKMRAKRVELSWGLLGDATSKGWGDGKPDIKLVPDKERKGLWLLKNFTFKKGEFKFRLNNDWNINYGDNLADAVLDLYGENIKIEAGVYNIELDLTDEATPRYTVLKIE